MDIASIVGMLTAVGLICTAIVVGGGSFLSFIDPASAMVVVGGAISAALICFPLGSLLRSPSVFMKVVFNKQEDVVAMIKKLVELAEVARREGLLALETKLPELENKFMQLGVQMAVDGSRPEVIEDIMRTEIDAVATRHREGKVVFDQIGRFAPAYGMIGTLMGLIIMLADMSDPTKIGAGMAVALITTLYGAIVANVFFLPWAEKLAYLSKKELAAMEIIVRGILAIQSGENPRVVDQKLSTFLPPKDREREEAA